MSDAQSVTSTSSSTSGGFVSTKWGGDEECLEHPTPPSPPPRIHTHTLSETCAAKQDIFFLKEALNWHARNFNSMISNIQQRLDGIANRIDSGGVPPAALTRARSATLGHNTGGGNTSLFSTSPLASHHLRASWPNYLSYSSTSAMPSNLATMQLEAAKQWKTTLAGFGGWSSGGWW